MNKNEIAALFLNEREKQLRKRSLKHDRMHVNHELARAAAAYAMPIGYGVDNLWPEDWSYRAKNNRDPKGRIQNLVMAGALLMAEIERLTKDD